jgi:predicted DNA-binding transcriptional regulator
LSQERVIRALVGLGLSQTDAQIYIYLATMGPKKIEDIMKELQLQDHLLRTSLENLRNKKIVNPTLEHSIFFQALPFEKALELLVQANMVTTRNIERNKAKILSKWETIIKYDKSTNSSPSEDKTAC